MARQPTKPFPATICIDVKRVHTCRYRHQVPTFDILVEDKCLDNCNIRWPCKVPVQGPTTALSPTATTMSGAAVWDSSLRHECNRELPLACLLLDGQPKTYCVRTKLLMALSSLDIVDEAEQMGFIKQHLADCQMIPRFRPGMRPGPHFSPFRYEFKLRHSNGTTVQVVGLPNLREALQKTLVPEWKAKQQTHTTSSPAVAAAQSDGPAAAVKRRRLSASAVAPVTPNSKQTHVTAAAPAAGAALGRSEDAAASQPGSPVPLRRSARRSSLAAAAAASPPPQEQRSAAAGTAAAGVNAASGPGEQASQLAARTVTRRSSSSAAAAPPTAAAAAAALPAASAATVAAAQPVAVLQLAGAVSASAPPPPPAAAVRTVSASQLPIVPHHALQMTPAQYEALVQALGTSLDAAASAAAAGWSESSSTSAGSAEMITAASQNPKLYENTTFLQALHLVAQKEMSQAEAGKQVLELCHKILLRSRGTTSAPVAAGTALAAAFHS